MSRTKGGTLSALYPGGVGEEVGLEPGDILVSINGHTLRDLIDYRYYSADEHLVLIVEREGERHRLEIERDYDETLGIEFTAPVFDGMRQCENHCPFCFVQQMPKGMRRSLYLHDDDYRYSFLLGNFVTLTNLVQEDWQRIGEQRLSPLYVSIHATAPSVRRRVLSNPKSPDILPQLRRLGEMGIAVHGQIVIWPGVNDGQILRRSIEELIALWPTVRTLALVPVGLTRFHRGDVRLLRSEEATDVLDIASAYRQSLRRRLGRTWLYPSDELYLLAGRPVPDASFYDDEAQRENGVGLVRSLWDDWQFARDSLPELASHIARITLVCGTLIAPALGRIAADLSTLTGIVVQVVPVMNRWFGESVTVSGLLTGQDLLSALAGHDLGQHVLLPRAMFDAEGRFTLDDMTPAELGQELQVPLSLVSTMSEVLLALRGVAAL